jgi:hypothetical protein
MNQIFISKSLFDNFRNIKAIYVSKPQKKQKLEQIFYLKKMYLIIYQPIMDQLYSSFSYKKKEEFYE